MRQAHRYLSLDSDSRQTTILTVVTIRKVLHSLLNSLQTAKSLDTRYSDADSGYSVIVGVPFKSLVSDFRSITADEIDSRGSRRARNYMHRQT